MASPKPTILITESAGFSTRAADRLRAAGNLIQTDLDRPGLLRAVGAVDVLWVRLRHQIDAELMNHAPRLKIIVSPTTGLNHIDVATAASRGIRVLSLLGDREFLKTVHATAEHTVGLILALIRHIPAAQADVFQGAWRRDHFRGNELFGKTAGIVGYGRLGRMVGRLLQAFEMRVLAHDPHINPSEAEPEITLVPLPQLLHAADLVTVHVNLCAETTGLLGREFFAQMKPGAWFINTARGELVDESALLEALQTGHLAGAALDVLADEQSTGMAHHPLVQYARTHPKLILTPHIGGCTAESMEKTECWMVQKLCAELAAERTVVSAPCVV